VIIVPALDLRGGSTVRLERGDPARERRYDGDPVDRARRFVTDGAKRLHVVDLDGAFGTGENLAALRAICGAVDVPVQTGGGIRTREDIAARLDAGASDVILGTIVVEAPDDARRLIDEFDGRIIAGVDARGSRVATRGWLDDGGRDRDELIAELERWGIHRLIYTEISRDGTGAGYDVDAIAAVARETRMRVTASGGAQTIDDLHALRAASPANLEAAIVGRALYDGTIDLRDAIALIETKKRLA